MLNAFYLSNCPQRYWNISRSFMEYRRFKPVFDSVINANIGSAIIKSSTLSHHGSGTFLQSLSIYKQCSVCNRLKLSDWRKILMLSHYSRGDCLRPSNALFTRTITSLCNRDPLWNGIQSAVSTSICCISNRGSAEKANTILRLVSRATGAKVSSKSTPYICSYLIVTNIKILNNHNNCQTSTMNHTVRVRT